MNPKKTGTVFIILMVALTAYGFGSVANALNIGGNTIVNIIPSNFTSFDQQQITPISNPSFKPVYLVQHIVINTTNTSSISNDSNLVNHTTNQDSNQ